MRLAPAIAIVLALPVLAGCIGQTPTGVAAPTAAENPRGPMVVAAVIDTGINPYHEAFRDDSDLAHTHPSKYLEGYPADVPALNLTLDASSWEAAVQEDCDVWNSVEKGQLYWIPGTRIIGARTIMDADGECGDDEPPGPGHILDRGGHGTMTASRLAGDGYGLCPDCRIVANQGFSSGAMKWASDQAWIDLQSNSWGHLPSGYVTGSQDRQEVVDAAAAQPAFVAGGNGLAGFFGVSGHPAYTDDIAGPQGIIMVGGHDNGYYTPWSMTMPHVVADVNSHPAAEHESMDGDGNIGGGTSGATPFAAGTFARMVLEGRRQVDDLGVGVRDGRLVVAEDGMAPEDGPVSDGDLTLTEAKTVFYHTANPRPVKDGRYDGDRCQATDPSLVCTLYPTVPVQWSDVPEEVPAYYFVGYGQVGNVTLMDHIAALLGQEPIPDRPMADRFYGFDGTMRETFDDAQP